MDFFPVEHGGRIYVRIREFKGSKCLDIRRFFEKDGGWLPTTKGVSILFEDFPKLMACLDRIVESAGSVSPPERAGMLDSRRDENDGDEIPF